MKISTTAEPAVLKQMRRGRGWPLGLAAAGLVMAAVTTGGPAMAAASHPTTAAPVQGKAWHTGWSWTYDQTWTYDTSSVSATLNESVKYAVTGVTTYDGYNAYEVALTGSISSGSGSADGFTIKVTSGSVTGTAYFRTSDLGLINETQTQTAKGTVDSIFALTAAITIDLAPTPVWRTEVFPLSAGNKWSEALSVGYSGTYTYNATVASGSSTIGPGTIAVSAPDKVTAPKITVPISTSAIATDYENATASSTTKDQRWWAAKYDNVAKEVLEVPISSGTLTMDRTLSAASTPAPSTSVTEGVTPAKACPGATVKVLGKVTPAASGTAVSVVLDESVLGTGMQETASTTESATGAYSVNLTAPTAADGMSKTGALGSWGITVSAGSGSQLGTLVVEPTTTTGC